MDIYASDCAGLDAAKVDMLKVTVSWETVIVISGAEVRVYGAVVDEGRPEEFKNEVMCSCLVQRIARECREE